MGLESIKKGERFSMTAEYKAMEDERDKMDPQESSHPLS